MAFAPKLLIGGVTLGGVGAGFGIEASTTSRSKRFAKRPFTVNNECRLHKLVAIGNPASTAFAPVTKNEIQELISTGKGDFSSIERACSSNPGKDIFASNKGRDGWKYRNEEQNDSMHGSKFQEYLKR
ncbi:hypothetical protein MHC_02390 [Mycoplasma haemocanis str. Illinois]|uniref:Uncharacterized protein n=1 Tax=Mycoplasma haemocanis (strain Illinois) TaxID=1111676 RepID=H6N6S0_MYCHN|nr:hypothetical protein [Mycoplasma haemocanis]AEW45342.1 hypothetical protein MHC_02390 [Mycoplasma haemocanis str. Illinois]